MMPQPFSVSQVSAAEKEKLLRWGSEGDETQRSEFIKLLKIINYRLQFEPLDDWSESYLELPHLQLQLRFGSADWLGVGYGVNLLDRVVFISSFIKFQG